MNTFQDIVDGKRTLFATEAILPLVPHAKFKRSKGLGTFRPLRGQTR